MKGITAVAAAGVGVAAAEYGIASYFFRRTILRQKAKTERTMKMSGTDWDQYMPKMKVWKEWMLAQPHEDVYITSDDGLKLHGTFFPIEGSQKLVVCFHGYTSQGMSDYIGLSNYYLPKGYQLLLVDERTHGQSEGTYITFGCKDRFDALRWLTYAEERCGKACEIWMHGTSMGGATVLMTSSLELPSTVKGIISDCAFTSAWEVFGHVLHSMYHLPAFPILQIADQLAQRKGGFSLRECSAEDEVKYAKVPILFIHGDSDTFVPSWMCDKVYDACIAPKEKLLIEGAGHCEAFYKDPVKYEAKLTEFLNTYGQIS